MRVSDQSRPTEERPEFRQDDIPPPGFVGSDPVPLFLAYPKARETLARLGLAEACDRLDAACARIGLGVDEALLQLALTLMPAPVPTKQRLDNLGIGELIDLIVQRHHAWTRAELGRLSVLARALSNGDEVIALLAHFGADVLAHMWDEEHRLFPLCRSLEEVGPETEDGQLVLAFRGMSHSHDEIDVELAELHAGIAALAGSSPAAQALLAGLQALARDMEQHTLLEDEFLLPAATSAEELLRSQDRVRRRGATHISARLRPKG